MLSHGRGPSLRCLARKTTRPADAFSSPTPPALSGRVFYISTYLQPEVVEKNWHTLFFKMYWLVYNRRNAMISYGIIRIATYLVGKGTPAGSIAPRLTET
jgi:hypothetical protein